MLEDGGFKEYQAAVGRFIQERGSFINGWFNPNAYGIANIALHQYLSTVKSLEVDEQVVKAIVCNMATDLNCSTCSVESVYLVQRFSASRPFDSEDTVRFKPIAEEDIDQFARVPNIIDTFGGRSSGLVAGEIAEVPVILQLLPDP